MIKNRAGSLYFFSVVCISLSGCADIAQNAYDSLREPTEDELTMRIIDSTCSDLQGISKGNGPFSTAEYMKLVRVNRPDTTKSGGECKIECTGGERLSSEKRVEICNQKISVEVAKQRSEEAKKAAEFAQQSAIAKANTEKMYSDLVAKGYTQISFDDFQLDANSLPNGKKIYINGYYEAFGNIQYLVRIPTIGNPQQYIIPLITDNASRKSRKILIRMQEACIPGVSACQMTAIGRVTRCKISFLSSSKTKTCISLDNFFYY